MKKGKIFRTSFLVIFCFVISRPAKVCNYGIFLLIVKVKRETKDSLVPATKRESLVPSPGKQVSNPRVEWSEVGRKDLMNLLSVIVNFNSSENRTSVLEKQTRERKTEIPFLLLFFL